MGSSTTKLPKTEKNLKDLECSIFNIGLGEMQGWRGNMEDASLIHIAQNHTPPEEEELLDNTSIDSESASSSIVKELNLTDKSERTKLKQDIKSKSPECNISIIGVFDGHGGSFISRFVAENFMTVFNNAWVKSYLKGMNNGHKKPAKIIKDKIDYEDLNTITIDKLEQLLIQTFLDMDELLMLKTVDRLVHDYKHFKRDDLVLSDVSQLLSEEYDQEVIRENFAYYMGTTGNVVCLYENYLIVANVGDSMSVLFTEGKAVELNTEHKVSTPGEEERVLKAGLHVINNRVDGKLNLTRAIGDLQFKNRKLRPYEQAVTAYPELTTYELDESSEFVISACDGIWDCVEPQKLCEFVSKELKAGKKISEIIARIEDMVLSNTNNSPIGTDNMTCIILQFK
mmetsp:Transcript_22397/g.23331  ORF Transcript_22397/g.23331 Transcript_22397/m.23331 type:complete len:398 (+) Transcript_22397:1-1194(+)